MLKLREVFASKGSHREYRRLLSEWEDDFGGPQPPHGTAVVPHPAVHLQDITFIEDGNKDMHPHKPKLVNVSKLRMLSHTFDRIHRFQQRRCGFGLCFPVERVAPLSVVVVGVEMASAARCILHIYPPHHFDLTVNTRPARTPRYNLEPVPLILTSLNWETKEHHVRSDADKKMLAMRFGDEVRRCKAQEYGDVDEPSLTRSSSVESGSGDRTRSLSTASVASNLRFYYGKTEAPRLTSRNNSSASAKARGRWGQVRANVALRKKTWSSDSSS